MDGSFRSSERGTGMGDSFRAERRATEPLDGSDHGSVASARELLGSALRNSFRRSRNDDTMSECGTTATDPTDPLNFRQSYRLTKQTSASDLRKSFTETKTIQSFRKLASNISEMSFLSLVLMLLLLLLIVLWLLSIVALHFDAFIIDVISVDIIIKINAI